MLLFSRIAVALLGATTAHAFVKAPTVFSSHTKAPVLTSNTQAPVQYYSYAPARSLTALSMASRAVRRGRDFYSILGINRDASATDIKQAFRSLVKHYHPDTNPGQEVETQTARFQELNHAYKVLNNVELKKKYDVYGEPVKGDDLLMELEIENLAADFGSEERVRLMRFESCGACSGSGFATCRPCVGRGVRVGVTRTPEGLVETACQTCNGCKGRGRNITESCSDCAGEGVYRKLKQIYVTIEGGVHDGHVMKVEGEGDAGSSGGPNGDLYISLKVQSGWWSSAKTKVVEPYSTPTRMNSF